MLSSRATLMAVRALGVAAGLSVAGVCSAAGGAAGVGAEGPLFTQIAGTQVETPIGGHVMRTRYVTANANLVNELSPLDGTPAETVTLNLFDDVTVTARRTAVENGYGGGWVWGGTLAEHDGQSWVTISVAGDAIYADLHGPHFGRFEIRSVGNGVFTVSQIDRSALPACGTDLPQEIANPPEDVFAVHAGDGGDGTTDNPIVDIAVFYTPLARSTAGGTNGMVATANNFIFFTNQSYGRSLVNHRLRLVHLAEVVYTESASMGTDLDRFRVFGDGFMDSVHLDRNTYGADLMHLISGTPNGACGIAYIMLSNSTGFSSLAFAVTAIQCGGSTFAHEVGHNMGCAHDRPNAGSALNCFAYGHRFTAGSPSNLFITIMSYQPGSEIPYFSNPNVLYPPTGANQQPTGVAEGPGCPQFIATDNAQNMNLSSPTVALFRATQVGNDPPGAFNLTNPANNAIGVPLVVALNWQAALNANEYDLTLSANPSLASPIVQSTVTSPSFVINSGLLAHRTTYYWSVTARGFGGQTVGTPSVAQFRTQPFGDANADGIVNFNDLNIVLGQFGQTGSGLNGDVNGDQIVNFADLNAVLSNFGLS